MPAIADMTTFKALLEGGKSGPVIVPGKPEESLLVLQAEGKQKPFMPPKNTLAVIRPPTATTPTQ